MNPTPPASRAARIARALTLGYGFQAVVALTGLLLTPFLLSRLGVVDLGRWLVAGQVLGLLGLLDLGVTALLPREVARASGSAEGESVAEVVRRGVWLVWLQTPLVALVAVAVWFGVSASSPDLEGPLAVVLTAFVVQFPLRLAAAILNGLQDLTFCAALTAAAWVVTTTVSVGLVLGGWGLYSLALGWAAGQLLACGVARWRVRVKFPTTRAVRGWPGRTALVVFLGPSLWTTLRQVAQLLLNGAELIVLGLMSGPAAVVLYSCTVKMINLVNSQPYLIATTALPALAELQAAGDRERLWHACRALGLAMLLVSGGLAIAVLAANTAFVTHWVGPDQYGGPLLTLLAVLAMTLRHAVFTLSLIVFALGYDRRLSITAIADAAVTVSATVVWVAAVGVIGIPLGSLTGLLLTIGAVAIWTLAGVQGGSPWRVVEWAVPWAIRFVAVASPLAVIAFTPFAADPVPAGGFLVGSLSIYLCLVYPLLHREPLRGYGERVTALLRRKFVPSISTRPF